MGLNLRNGQWMESQTGLGGLLQEVGISYRWELIGGRFNLGEIVAGVMPRLCIVRALPVPPEEIEELANQYPGTTFVIVCHSLPSHLMVMANTLERWSGFIRTSINCDNVYLATPDKRQQWKHFTPRSLWLPNTIQPLGPITRRTPGEILQLGITCRRDPIKNIPAQLLAAARVNQVWPCRVHLFIKDGIDDIKHTCDSLGLDVVTYGWAIHEQYRETMSQEIDVGLQASFCESWNYVAAEYLLAGKPVVGSPAITFLPENMQADPNDIADLAGMILAHAKRLTVQPEWSEEIADLGRAVASEHNRAAVATIQALMGGRL